MRKRVQQRMARADVTRHAWLDYHEMWYTCHQRSLSYSRLNTSCILSEKHEHHENDNISCRRSCQGLDGTSRCSMTHFLGSRSNIICVAAKSFEICAFAHACTGSWIHATSRVGPFARGKRSVLAQPHTPECSEHYGSMRPQACNDCTPGTSFFTPKHPRRTPVLCPKQAGQQNIK